MKATRALVEPRASGRRRPPASTAIRAIAIAALLPALAACARRAPLPPRPAAAAPAPPAPPAALFVPLPAAQVAGVRNPHQYQGKPLCQRCHLVTGVLRAEPIALCMSCHPQRHRSHPIDVVQRSAVTDIPLLPGNKVACHTCHDPHDTKKQEAGLRLPYEELCLRCHRRHH